jgi:hypothetical protein
VHSPVGTSSPDKASTSSRAIVLVRADPNAGAIVPANKSKRSPEQGPRRIRRPFSVAEVEALVLAVEKLGTGRYIVLFTLHSFWLTRKIFWPLFSYSIRCVSCRWRDVKLRAFDNAKHRTYVDLKVYICLCTPMLVTI